MVDAVVPAEDDQEEPEADGPKRPAPRARVSLRAASWGTSVPSIIEDVLDVDLAVTAPVGLGEQYRVAPGATITVLWDEPTGPWQLPCTLSSELARDVPQWQLRPSGPPLQDQHRRHTRAQTEVAVSVVHERRAIEAHLADLSEGGMRCVLEGEGVIGVGETISAELDLEGAVVTLQGEVVRVTVGGNRSRTIAVAFTEVPPGMADLLRRHVFAEQARAHARTIS